MANVSRYLQEGISIDYTPAAAAYAGNIIRIGSLCAFLPVDIAANALGATALSGVIRAPFVGGVVGNIGDNVWWDANGTPYGGAVADGACTLAASAGDWWVGTLVRATSATGNTCDVALNVENPNLPAFQGKTHIAATNNLTLVAATHSGGVMHMTVASKTFTLPTGAAGMDYVLVNDCANGSLLTVTPDGTEIFEGANLTIAGSKSAVNTALTAVRGDYLHVVCDVAATSWKVVGKRGVWVTS